LVTVSLVTVELAECVVPHRVGRVVFARILQLSGELGQPIYSCSVHLIVPFCLQFRHPLAPFSQLAHFILKVSTPQGFWSTLSSTG